MLPPGLPLISKWSGKNTTIQGQGKVWEFYFDSGKIDIIFEEKSGKIGNYITLLAPISYNCWLEEIFQVNVISVMVIVLEVEARGCCYI